MLTSLVFFSIIIQPRICYVGYLYDCKCMLTWLAFMFCVAASRCWVIHWNMVQS
jgi:hypothetical protein